MKISYDFILLPAIALLITSCSGADAAIETDAGYGVETRPIVRPRPSPTPSPSLKDAGQDEPNQPEQEPPTFPPECFRQSATKTWNCCALDLLGFDPSEPVLDPQEQLIRQMELQDMLSACAPSH